MFAEPGEIVRFEAMRRARITLEASQLASS